MSDPRLIDLALELRHETPAAYLVHDGDRQVWLPKSMVEKEEICSSAHPRQTMFTFTMPEWLATEKELI